MDVQMLTNAMSPSDIDGDARDKNFVQINELVHGRHNSIASALELRLSCTNPFKWLVRNSGEANDGNFVQMTPFLFQRTVKLCYKPHVSRQ